MSTPRSTLVRLACGAGLVTGFVLMASVFVPDTSQGETSRRVNRPVSRSAISIDPHEGLFSLGMIEDARLRVEIFSGDSEPWYSVYDTTSGRLLASLLTARELSEAFPDLNIRQMQFGVPAHDDPKGAEHSLMIAGPDSSHSE